MGMGEDTDKAFQSEYQEHDVEPESAAWSSAHQPDERHFYFIPFGTGGHTG